MNLTHLNLIAIINASDMNDDEKVAKIAEIRASLSNDKKNEVDVLLISQIKSLKKSIDNLNKNFHELTEIYQKVKELNEKLTSEPFYNATFVGVAETPRGQLFRIKYHNNDMFVPFSEELDLESLVPGDEVLLNEHRNFVLSKISSAKSTGYVATVDRTLGNSRIVVSHAGSDHIVDTIPDLQLNPGDVVCWNRDSNMAVEKIAQDEPVSSSVTNKLQVENIRGNNLKPVVERITNTLLHRDTAALYDVDGHTNKILLLGEPGTGKTTFAHAVSKELERKTKQPVYFKYIKGEELSSPYVGQTSSNLRAMFKECNDYVKSGEKICVLFMDEIDVYRSRGLSHNHHHDRHTNTLLAEISSLHPRVVLLAATNRAGTLDSALRDRFSMEIKFSRPNRKTAVEIFEVHLPDELLFKDNGRASANQVRKQIIEHAVSRLYSPNADNDIAVLKFRDGKTRLVKASELTSGRFISQIASSIKQSAFHRHSSGGNPGIDFSDMNAAIDNAIARMRMTLDRQNIYNYLSDLPQDIDVISVEPVMSHRTSININQ